MEPSRFWLRRDNDDRARQVVYDEVQLNRYSDRQKRAILKLIARGKSASHRDIRQAARRARKRTAGERMVTFALALCAIAVFVILFTSRHHAPNRATATELTASGHAVVDKGDASARDLTTAMERADRAWLSDVGAGNVVSAADGSDVLSLPQGSSPAAAGEGATSHTTRSRHHRRR